MAIDTADKRSSAINNGLPWRSMYWTPDGSIAAADRLHVGNMYRGIAAVATLNLVANLFTNVSVFFSHVLTRGGIGTKFRLSGGSSRKHYEI